MSSAVAASRGCSSHGSRSLPRDLHLARPRRRGSTSLSSAAGAFPRSADLHADHQRRLRVGRREVRRQLDEASFGQRSAVRHSSARGSPKSDGVARSCSSPPCQSPASTSVGAQVAEQRHRRLAEQERVLSPQQRHGRGLGCAHSRMLPGAADRRRSAVSVRPSRPGRRLERHRDRPMLVGPPDRGTRRPRALRSSPGPDGRSRSRRR